MKKVLVIGLILFLSGVSICYSGPFDVQDAEAKKTALMVRELLGGDSYENIIKANYPHSTISWSGRAVPGTGPVVTYVVYCEVKNQKEEALYYYFELSVADINSNEALKSKYGIE